MTAPEDADRVDSHHEQLSSQEWALGVHQSVLAGFDILAQGQLQYFQQFLQLNRIRVADLHDGIRGRSQAVEPLAFFRQATEATLLHGVRSLGLMTASQWAVSSRLLRSTVGPVWSDAHCQINKEEKEHEA